MKSRLLYGILGVSACAALFSCHKQPGNPEGTDGGKVVYVESNDWHAGANAILAYRQKADGTLTPLAGSPFLTRGAGLANPKQVLGPDDSDDPIAISSDGQFLLAVNGGSNTIAVFSINPDGGLVAVPGSPFPSGGKTPCSVALNGRYVYVANKSFNPLDSITLTEAPNYTTFTVDGAGQLYPVPGGTVNVPVGSSPSQVVVSNDHQFLFATDFLAFMLPTEEPTGTLVSFDAGFNGGLKMVPGSPFVLPSGDGGALGLIQNPRSNTLYVGFPVAGAFGVYSIDPGSGALSFETSLVAGPGTCWERTNAEGTRLYTLNSAENGVGIYNVDNPDAPVFIAKLVLKDSGPTIGTGTAVSSECFALNFSPDGKILYVVSQGSNPDFALGNFNWLHALKVQADGTLAEPNDPLQLPVDSDVRPQGVVTR